MNGVDMAETVMPKPVNSMMNSLSGSAVAVDLCSAKDKKLFVQINAAGEPPFQGTGMLLYVNIYVINMKAKMLFLGDIYYL